MSVNSTIFEPVSKSYWKCTIHGHDNIIKIWTRGGSPINIDSLYIGLPLRVQILGTYLTDGAIIKIWTRGGSRIYIDSLYIYRTTSAGPDFGDVPTHGNEAMLKLRLPHQPTTVETDCHWVDCGLHRFRPKTENGSLCWQSMLAVYVVVTTTDLPCSSQ